MTESASPESTGSTLTDSPQVEEKAVIQLLVPLIESRVNQDPVALVMAERTLDVALDPFDEPVTEMVDVVVIGLGPGGEYVANELLSRGLRVVAIESELMGGECADWGCVPTKMMVRAANLLAEAGRVSEMAGSATVTPDWKPVATRIREEATHSWNDNELVVEFERKGGRFIRGTARLVDGADRSLDRWDFESGAIGSDGGDSALPRRRSWRAPVLTSLRRGDRHRSTKHGSRRHRTGGTPLLE